MDASVAETTVSSDHNHEATSHGKTVPTIPAADTGFSLALAFFRKYTCNHARRRHFDRVFPYREREYADNRESLARKSSDRVKQWSGRKGRSVSEFPRLEEMEIPRGKVAFQSFSRLWINSARFERSEGNVSTPHMRSVYSSLLDEVRETRGSREKISGRIIGDGRTRSLRRNRPVCFDLGFARREMRAARVRRLMRRKEAS